MWSATWLTATAVCLVEVYFALATRYQFSGDRIADCLIAPVLKDDVSVHAIDEDPLIQGLEMCWGSTRVSIGDALMWAEARTAGATAVYPFYQRFPDEGIDVRG